MIISQFQETRRFIGRLDPGQDVIAGFKTICGENHIQCGWITASAILRNVELLPVSGDGSGFGEAEALEGTVLCPGLSGNVSTRDGNLDIRLYASLLSVGKAGGKSVTGTGGVIEGGEVLLCEFTILAVEDATLVRQSDDGFGSWQQLQTPFDYDMASVVPRHPSGPLARPTPAPIYQSADEDEATELIILEMKVGDFVDHPRFGVCKIVHAPVDEKLSIRLPTGKHVDLHLGVMRVLPPKQAGGRKIFQVEVKRKG